MEYKLTEAKANIYPKAREEKKQKQTKKKKKKQS